MQSTITINIRNMVCQRCINVVSNELMEAGFDIQHIELGHAVVLVTPRADMVKLGRNLMSHGFELLDDKSAILINNMKAFIIDFIRSGKLEDKRSNFSDILEQHFKKDYSALSLLFSQSHDTTLEKYIIAQKIEYVKELLTYEERNLSEISYYLGYSSPAYLSSQFKQVTGFSPSMFKKIKHHPRIPLEKI